jgi:hypothetical protein
MEGTDPDDVAQLCMAHDQSISQSVQLISQSTTPSFSPSCNLQTWSSPATACTPIWALKHCAACKHLPAGQARNRRLRRMAAAGDVAQQCIKLVRRQGYYVSVWTNAGRWIEQTGGSALLGKARCVLDMATWSVPQNVLLPCRTLKHVLALY